MWNSRIHLGNIWTNTLKRCVAVVGEILFGGFFWLFLGFPLSYSPYTKVKFKNWKDSELVLLLLLLLTDWVYILV